MTYTLGKNHFVRFEKQGEFLVLMETLPDGSKRRFIEDPENNEDGVSDNE